MYEVELTAFLKDYSRVKSLLKEFDNTPQLYVYHDFYFDKKEQLVNKKQELRLRKKINKTTGVSQVYFTLKDSPFENTTLSKPEYETQVESLEITTQILNKLEFSLDIDYKKYVVLFTFKFKGYQIEVSLVSLDELDDTFIEIETLIKQEEHTTLAFDVLYQLLESLKIPREELTTIYYQTLVKNARRPS